MRSVATQNPVSNPLFLFLLARTFQGAIEAYTPAPGLVSTTTFQGITTERWLAGSHADRRLRQLREHAPGRISSASQQLRGELWTGDSSKSVAVMDIRYSAGINPPKPSPGGAVRAAFRREERVAEVIDALNDIQAVAS